MQDMGDFFKLLMVSVLLYTLPITLFGQEDVSVKFSFKRPNEFVCEIQNMTDNRITIWLNKERAEGHSELYFDILSDQNDTIRYVFYELMKDVNNQSQSLRLNPGQIYTISYKDGYKWKFIEARVLVKYYEQIPNNKVQFYMKTFDLSKIRNIAYIPIPQVLREEED